MLNFCFQSALLEQYADACRMRCEVLIHLDRPVEALHWSRLATQYKPGELTNAHVLAFADTHSLETW